MSLFDTYMVVSSDVLLSTLPLPMLLTLTLSSIVPVLQTQARGKEKAAPCLRR